MNTRSPGRLVAAMGLVVVLAGCASAPDADRGRPAMNPQTQEDIRSTLVGRWSSLASEVRPSNVKNPDGSLKPFYLKREFRYLPDDRFELTIVNSADPYGKVALARILIKGHMFWRGEHPIAPGAQKVDFVSDEAY
jgi:hypothetical protein